MTKRKNNARKVANVVTHFTNTYTYDDGRLLAFQTLCRDLRVSVGTSLTQCKKNIKNANVNIYDFVRTQQAGGDVSTVKFPSNNALRLDIRNNPNRRFPLKKAKGNELIEAMLIYV